MASELAAFTAVAAAIGAAGSIGQAISRLVEVWRTRAAVEVSWSLASESFDASQSATLHYDANFSVNARLKGRHPVVIDSAGIGLAEGLPRRPPWFKSKKVWTVPIFEGLEGVGRPFPATLTPETPSVAAFVEMNKLRRSLEGREHGLPYCVWVSTSIGRREKKLPASMVKYLTTAVVQAAE